MFSRDSYFKKEQKRIQEEIGTALLELVLQFLPHLQPKQSDRDDMWELVAIKINNQRISEVAQESRGNVKQVEEIPQLNGLFVREIYEKMLKTWTERYIRFIPHHGFTKPDDIRSELKTHDDFLLLELYQLRGYGYEVMSNLAKEKFEANQRAQFDATYNGTSEPGESASQMLARHKESSGDVKLEALQRQLEKAQDKLAQVEAENKRLLELNHELILQMKGGRE
ncbi:hypothetical protein DICA3_C13652 [Diutina catenulata]